MIRLGKSIVRGPERGITSLLWVPKGPPCPGLRYGDFISDSGNSQVPAGLLCTYHGHFINIALFVGSFFVELNDCT